MYATTGHTTSHEGALVPDTMEGMTVMHANMDTMERPATKKQVLPRKSIQELTDSEWREYIEILNMTRSYNSGYKVVLGEYIPGTTNIDMSDINLYDLFVWQHHFASKDTACGGKLFYNVPVSF